MTLLITCTVWVIKLAVEDVMTSVHLIPLTPTLVTRCILLVIGHVQQLHALSVLVGTSTYVTVGWRGLGYHYGVVKGIKDVNYYHLSVESNSRSFGVFIIIILYSCINVFFKCLFYIHVGILNKMI